MPRRIEVELTSRRDDGSWTWRAAGARQPKGELDGSLLPEAAKVGDVVKAEAEFDVDGITVVAIEAPKATRREPERLEILGSGRDEQPVTTTLVSRRGRGGDDRRPRSRDRDGDRSGRGDRPERDRGPRRDRPERRDGGDRGPRGRGERGDRGDRSGGDRPNRDRNEHGERSRGTRSDRDGDGRGARRPRPARPAPEPKAKPRRLRAGRTHRNELMASLPEEHKPIAEEALRAGIPAVREAVRKQNEQARTSGSPEIKAEGLVAIAEELLPRLRAAEWHDKADAALAHIDEVSLTDLRAVVNAADRDARDDVTRPLADELRAALTRRVELEHTTWLAEITSTLADGRTVRALRDSSHPPKAGAPLPADLSARLAEAASASLTADTNPDRYATVLDALAYSPVRSVVTVQGVPAEPGDALLTAVRKLAPRLPQVAAAFGIEAGGAKRRPTPPPPPPAVTQPPIEPVAQAEPVDLTEGAEPAGSAEPIDAPTAPAAEPEGEPV